MPERFDKKEKGLVFFDYTHLDLILKRIGWDEEHLKGEKCLVCGCQLTKENIGGFTRSFPVKAVCRKFECMVSVLLEKKEMMLQRAINWLMNKKINKLKAKLSPQKILEVTMLDDKGHSLVVSPTFCLEHGITHLKVTHNRFGSNTILNLDLRFAYRRGKKGSF